jgi:hypothetical protein
MEAQTFRFGNIQKAATFKTENFGGMLLIWNSGK